MLGSRVAGLALLIAYLCSGCATHDLPLEQQYDIERGIYSESVGELHGGESLRHLGYPVRQLETVVRAIYRNRHYRSVWFQGIKLSKRGRELFRLFSTVEEEGLKPTDYLPSFTPQNLPPPEDIPRAEIQLTIALGRLLIDLQDGRPYVRTADGEKTRLAEVNTIIEELPDIAESGDLSSLFEQHRPGHSQYEKLRRAIDRYRSVVATGGFPMIENGKDIKQGEHDERIVLIKNRLAMTGEFSARAVSDELFDEKLHDAITGFQRNMGIPVTGQIDRVTIAELNLPAVARLNTLLVNLERWRWLPEDRAAEKLVYVNIAGFELAAVSNHQLALRMPIIVGKQYLETPVFSSRIEKIEINPYWNVPTSIADKEILPRVKKDPSYLARQHMQVVRTRDGGERIRQEPGSWNALGRIKFVLPNNFDVYLHDTPSPKLFRENVRAFSHGCIRLSEPMAFAAFLLSTPADPWSADRVRQIVDTGRTKSITLKSPVRADIIYRTAWVDLDGSVRFRPDIYGRDERMINALATERTRKASDETVR